jgi:broad specificity phosphatase PhoE
MALELPKGLTLYFARHGQTVANIEGRFQGRTIDTPLTDLGLKQAKALGTIMKREVSDLARLDRVVSPMNRAKQTMRIALSAFEPPPLDFRTDDRILEINLGAWDGLTAAEARALDPSAYERRESNKWTVRVPGGGENYADVAARAEAWIHDLKSNTFAISHGAFTRVLRGLFKGLNWKQMSDLDEPQGCVFRAKGSAVERLDP